MEPRTPPTEITSYECQKPTPAKARIQGAIDFLESEGIAGKKGAVFRMVIGEAGFFFERRW